jgi:hypothetical protein
MSLERNAKTSTNGLLGMDVMLSGVRKQQPLINTTLQGKGFPKLLRFLVTFICSLDGVATTQAPSSYIKMNTFSIALL